MVHLLEDCNLCAIHAKRVTISKYWLHSSFCPVQPKVFPDVYTGLSMQSRTHPTFHTFLKIVGGCLQCQRTCSLRGASGDHWLAYHPTKSVRGSAKEHTVCVHSDAQGASVIMLKFLPACHTPFVVRNNDHVELS